jgi:hypothetical protein
MLHPRAACLSALLLLPSGPAALRAAEVRVTAGTIDDNRQTSTKFGGGGLELEVKLVGDAVGDARAARILVQKAVDESGRDLMSDKAREPEFSKVGEGAQPMKINLKNPARAASAIKEISGTVELFAPSRDPASSVVIDKVMTRMDKPLSSPALKSAKIEAKVISPKTYREKSKMSEADFEKEMEKHKGELGEMEAEQAKAMMALAKGLMSMMGEVGENDLVLQIADPENRIFEVEVVGRDGKKIDTNGSMSSNDTRILNFKEKLPADAKLRFLLKTKKSVTTASFSLKDVPLP